MTALSKGFREKLLRNHWVSRFRSSPAMQKIAGNAGWMGGDQAVRMAIGIVVGAIVARHLGPERLGVLSYATVLITFLSCISNYGLEIYLTGELAHGKTDQAKVLKTALGVRLMTGLVALCILFFYIYLVPHSPRERGILLVAGAALLVQAMSISTSYFQAHMLAKVNAVAGSIGFAIASSARLTCVFLAAPLVFFAGTNPLGLLISHSISFYRLWTRLPEIWRASFDREIAGGLFRAGLPLMFATMLAGTSRYIDQVFLKFMTDDAELGIYAAAARISEMSYIIASILGASTMPMLVRCKIQRPALFYNRLQAYYSLNAFAAYGVAICVTAAAPLIISILYGAQFQPSIMVLQVHIWSCLFIYLHTARTQFLVVEKLLRYAFHMNAIGAVSNITLNWLLIPRFQANGAAIATVISYAIAGVLSSFMFQSLRQQGWLQLRALVFPIPKQLA